MFCYDIKGSLVEMNDRDYSNKLWEALDKTYELLTGSALLMLCTLIEFWVISMHNFVSNC